jgi:hypothetical protein
MRRERTCLSERNQGTIGLDISWQPAGQEQRLADARNRTPRAVLPTSTAFDARVSGDLLPGGRGHTVQLKLAKPKCHTRPSGRRAYTALGES